MDAQRLTWLFVTLLASAETLFALAVWGRELWSMYVSRKNGSRRQLAILFFLGMLYLLFSSLLLLIFTIEAIINPVPVLKETTLFVVSSSMLLGLPISVIILTSLSLVYKASFLDIGRRADSEPHEFGELPTAEEKKMIMSPAMTLFSFLAGNMEAIKLRR